MIGISTDVSKEGDFSVSQISLVNIGNFLFLEG